MRYTKSVPGQKKTSVPLICVCLFRTKGRCHFFLYPVIMVITKQTAVATAKPL
jgi:hypothetical protein